MTRAIQEFIDYHEKNGGLSRYIKLDYFLICSKYSVIPVNKEDMLLNFARLWECMQKVFK